MVQRQHRRVLNDVLSGLSGLTATPVDRDTCACTSPTPDSPARSQKSEYMYQALLARAPAPLQAGRYADGVRQASSSPTGA